MRHERLLADLRALLRHYDPVPARVTDAARRAFSTLSTTPHHKEHHMSAQPHQPHTATDQIQQPLTLVMPIKDGAAPGLRALIEGLAKAPVNPVEAKLDELQSVHFARFVLLEDDTRLAVITSYDGDFRKYVMDFVDHLGDIFDTLLSFVSDWPSAQPVQKYRDAFVDYVAAHDLKCVGSFYSAYPEVPVNDILPLRPTLAA